MKKNILTHSVIERPVYYVVDLSWLVTEAWETVGWQHFSLPDLVEMIFWTDPDVYLVILKEKFFQVHPQKTLTWSDIEQLESYWGEKRCGVLTRLEGQLDLQSLYDYTTYHRWLPLHQLVLKRTLPCYCPRPDHLVSERLY